ncbi:MAG: L-lactate dehydrogenase complex protein LldG [Actinomycetota bacterium]|jgi:L-lactate dehydrogenase complex protein LldG|nr:L-lactate dehydrogenase complex protein LldG [Actinomycetota bacterium]
MTSAKEEILGRIRAALGESRSVPTVVPRDYRTHGSDEPGSPAVLDLLEDRLVDYKASVHRTASADLAGTVRQVLAALLPEGGRVLVPAGLPPDWVPDASTDEGFDAPTLDGFAAVVTGCAAAAAQTGTIALDGAPDQGRRAITLVPDIHVCVVRAGQVVQTVPELLARLDPTRALTFVSGPSATSDIELQRVEGVHGPRTLAVVLVTD